RPQRHARAQARGQAAGLADAAAARAEAAGGARVEVVSSQALMRRATLAIAGVLAAWIAAAPPARAEESLPAIARRGVLRVGMFPGLAPFVAVGPDAEELRRLSHAGDAPVKAADGRVVAGFDVDLATAAAQALHAKLEIVLVDRFDALLPGLVAGRYDVVMSG